MVLSARRGDNFEALTSAEWSAGSREGCASLLVTKEFRRETHLPSNMLRQIQNPINNATLNAKLNLPSVTVRRAARLSHDAVMLVWRINFNVRSKITERIFYF
mgnify:CR=1 FL=1